MRDTIRIGTRSSALALWQANHVADTLRKHYPQCKRGPYFRKTTSRNRWERFIYGRTRGIYA